jgi:hypothetical protein
MSELPLLAFVAAGMVAFTTALFLNFFPRHGGRPSVARASFIVYFLSAVAIFWTTLSLAVRAPDPIHLVTAVVGMNLLGTAPLAGAWLSTTEAGRRPIARNSWAWPAAVSTALLGGELAMGVALLAAGNVEFGGGAIGGLTAALTQAGTSGWFFTGMLASMIPLLFWASFPAATRRWLLGLNVSGMVGPFVVPYPTIGAVAMAVAMGGTIALMVRELGAFRPATVHQVRAALGVTGGFALMTAGALATVAIPGPVGTVLFSVASVGVMAGEMVLLVRFVLAGTPHRATGAAVLSERPVERPAASSAQ